MPTLTYSPPGSRSPHTVELCKQITTLGRGPDNDICLADPLIAEDQAHIQMGDKGFHLTNLERRHPMQINGRNRRQAILKHGDVIKLGATTLTFRLLQEGTSSPSEFDELGAYRQIYDFSKNLMQEKSMPYLLEDLMDQVIELTRAERGFLILVEGSQPQVAVGRNMKGENLDDPVALYSDSVVARVVEQKKPLIVSNALHHDDFKSSASVVQLQLSSVMCVPLLERGKLLGVIYVGNSQVASLFEHKSLELLTIFAAQASLILHNALLYNELELDNQRLHNRLEELRYGGIIGSCEGITDVLRKVRKVATTDISVLIQGETGTGKELIAREIHRLSARNNGPFVTINCGAIPEALLESELFGHVKGAFTGAIANKIGKFKAADRGTLFLDEIGELPLSLQVKLLRSLQEKTITRVGDHRTESVDIRIVAATNRQLQREVAEGRFREDLYYRLNVVCLELPPLRERGEDIVVLARYLLQKFSREYSRPIKGFTPAAMIAMRKYAWPGNIRELENRIKKSVVLAEGSLIGADDLDIREDMLDPILPLSVAKERFQAHYINEVLERNNGNRTKTARDLGVDPRTIFRHLEKEGENKEE